MSSVEELELRATIKALEKRHADQREQIQRLELKVKSLSSELANARHMRSLAERQLEGVDEEAFDPTKQRGIGAIPIGGDFTEVEKIERMFGLGPTLDERLRILGTSSDEQLRQLTAGAEARETIAVATASANQVPATAVRLLQLLHGAGHALKRLLHHESVNEALLWVVVRAIQELPEAWFSETLDLEAWDPLSAPLPPLRSHLREPEPAKTADQPVRE